MGGVAVAWAFMHARVYMHCAVCAGALHFKKRFLNMATRAVFIVAAKRTPFGTYGGKLKGITATELCRVAACSALEAGRVPAEAVDSVIIGNVAQVS